MLCLYLQLAFRWMIMSSESQLVFVLVSHCAIPMCALAVVHSARIPCHLKPSGLYSSDGKRPDGASVVPWRYGKILVWDATCVDTCPITPSTGS